MARILLLEDDAVLSFDIANVLHSGEHDVEAFQRASDALIYLEDSEVDLIIADIFVKQGQIVPNEGGIRLIGSVRQLSAKNTPIIAISGSFSGPVGATTRSAARTVGATRTLSKPIDLGELLELVDELLKSRDLF